MEALVTISSVVIGPKYLQAEVVFSDDAPKQTSDNIAACAHIYQVMPHIIEHACMGEGSDTFRDVMSKTSTAHLLEHMAIELLSQTGLAGDITCGVTRNVLDKENTAVIQLLCVDDVLVCAALSSAVWIFNWAFGGAEDPVPNVEAIVDGLKVLVKTAENIGNKNESADKQAELIKDSAPCSEDSCSTGDTEHIEDEEHVRNVQNEVFEDAVMLEEEQTN